MDFTGVTRYRSMRISIIASILCVLTALSGCSGLPDNTGLEQTYALKNTSGTYLARYIDEAVDNHPGKSGFHLLVNGFDAFTARIVLAQHAEACIDAQYYMIHGDLTGMLFADELLKAADRGVRVRLLIDDMDLKYHDKALSILATHPDIDLRIFNPFSRNSWRLAQYLYGFGSVTRRMHNKTFTVDNQMTVVGGRNIGNEYFNADPSLAFGDLDVLAAGPVVKEVSDSFDTYWNHSKAYPIELLRPDLIEMAQQQETHDFFEDQIDRLPVKRYREELINSDLAHLIKTGKVKYDWAKSEVVADNPNKLESYETTSQYSLIKQILPALADVQKELVVFSPYFVPGEHGTKFLTDLSKNGVRVRIITNSLASTDVGLVHAGYRKYRKELLKAGVELYELNMKLSNQERKDAKLGSSKSSLHAKSFVIDGERVFIGSLNLDPRSITENTEIGIVLDSKEIASQVKDLFNLAVADQVFRVELEKAENGGEVLRWYGIEDGEKKVWTSDPYTGFFRRLGIWFAGLLPIESQI